MMEEEESYIYEEYPEEEITDGFDEPGEKLGEEDIEPEIQYIEDKKVEYDYKPAEKEKKPKIPKSEFRTKKKNYEL